MQTPEKHWNANSISSLPRETRTTILESLSGDDIRLLLGGWKFWAHDEQLAPDGDWRIWLLMGGRGSGKTRAGAEWIADGIRGRRMNRVALIAATHHEARTIMIEGESGLLSISDGATYEPSLRRVTWPGGAIAHVLSADEPDSIRGHQFDGAWCDDNTGSNFVSISGALTVTTAGGDTTNAVILRLQAGSSVGGTIGDVGNLYLGGSAWITLDARL